MSSRFHKAGENQEIIVDSIELGRDPQCVVRFDERFSTVSRRHAAIVKDGDGWKLVQLSKTNTTLLNGHPVKDEWYLQNGDEIQLSVNGPKLGFIIPTGKRSTVGSIGLTRRLSLFRQQALRPYKTAIVLLAIALAATAVGLGAWNYFLKTDLAGQRAALAQQIEASLTNKQMADSLANELVANNRKMADYETRIADMSAQVVEANSRASAAWSRAQSAVPAVISSGELTEGSKQTYFAAMFLMVDDEPIAGGTGTAFLLEDGRLVTAQHVVNPYFYIDPDDDSTLMLNALMVADPSSVTCRFIAISPTGDRIERTFTPDKIPFRMPYSLETWGSIEVDGENYPLRIADFESSQDWASLNVGRSGGLAFDNSWSTSLPLNTHLNILGYPKGVGAEDFHNVSPINSESSVAREGLDTDGCILLSNSETDYGNSGGPVFAKLGDRMVVVGIITGSNRLGSKTRRGSDGKWKDRVVPIANVR